MFYVCFSSDPIDLNQESLTTQHLINKFQSVSGKTLPKQLLPFTHALVFTFDASTETVQRKMTFDTLWNWIPSGKVYTMATRFWRTALPPYHTEPFQVKTELYLLL